METRHKKVDHYQAHTWELYFVKEIKAELPNALISWDISAWIGEPGFRTWWGFFQTAQIDFIHTSGGQARADLANLKPNELSWSFVSRTTGKKIIADCGNLFFF